MSADANVDVPLAERVAAGEADHAEIIEWLEARTIPIAQSISVAVEIPAVAGL